MWGGGGNESRECTENKKLYINWYLNQTKKNLNTPLVDMSDRNRSLRKLQSVCTDA